MIYSHLIATAATVYVVGLTKSFTSYTLHVSAISSTTGELVSSVDFPSSISDGPTAIVPLSSHSELPQVAWLEAGSIRSIGLTPKLTGKPSTLKGATYDKVIDVGLGSLGHFVALKGDGTGCVLKLDEATSGLKSIWEFSDSVGTSGAFAIANAFAY